MREYINDELVETTYLFCVKRISDTEAAKDLAQDILCEALRVIAAGKEFVSFYSWYWRMARNKYADYVAHKQNPTLPIEVAGGVAADVSEPLETLVAEEEISQLNYSLSRLASYQREMVIRFYLKEQSIVQIAKELELPEGTVKRRLFDVKKNLKERMENMSKTGTFSYAPAEVQWFWGYQGAEPQEIMHGSKMAPQVMVLCRQEAKTVNEIADEMGVAPIYLEEVIDKMVAKSLLVEQGKGKYIANCCVFPQEVYMKARLMANEAFHENEFPKRVTEKLLVLKDFITELDFYGNTFDYGYLMWYLYVVAGDCLGVAGTNKYLEKYKGKIADEAERKYRLTMQYVLPEEKMNYSLYGKMRVKSWSNLHQQFSTADYGALEFANNYDVEPFPVQRTNGVLEWNSGRDFWVDGTNISLLMTLADNPTKELTVHEQAKAADFLNKGILKKDGDRLVVQLPIFTRTIERKIWRLVYDAMAELALEYAEIVGNAVEEMLLPYVRKDLMSNFIHWDMRMFFQGIGELFYYGWDSVLEQPEDYERSAAGLYIVKC